MFTVFIFRNETMRRDYFKIRLGCIIIIMIILVHFYLSRVVYHSYALQSVYHAVAMQSPSVLLYGFDPKRVESHLWRGTSTVQFVVDCVISQ